MSAPALQTALFPQLTRDQIECMLPHGRTVDVAAGQTIFREGQREASFFIVLEGEIKITRQVNGREMFIAHHTEGHFTGELSILTGAENLATGTALVPSRLLQIDFFRAMHEVTGDSPELMSIVIPALAQRRPEAMALENQREKLASLGVLAAGLAHELNNPASAARRSATVLRERLARQRQTVVWLCERRVGEEGLHALEGLLNRAVGRQVEEIDPLARADRESEIGDQLEGLGVRDPWDVAAALVEVGITPDEVRELSEALPCEGVQIGLQWLAEALTLESLSREIEDASKRVADLVGSVKHYATLDQAPVQNVDVREGIESTLVMLGYKLRRHGIRVVREFAADTPVVTAVHGELNQVWTNLIDNAADAMPDGGTLTVRTLAEGDCLLVEIEDTGTGIPEEIRDRIFDPFFTTKPVGEGTGLGLDIAYKIVVDHHKGDLQVESEPGRTRFQIRVPSDL